MAIMLLRLIAILLVVATRGPPYLTPTLATCRVRTRSQPEVIRYRDRINNCVTIFSFLIR